MQPRRIVIVGGGFAGTTLAGALGRRLPAGWEVVLVSEESYTTFNPMLAEVAQAHCLAANLAAVARGGTTTAFRHRSRAMMATTGHLKGVARLGRLQLSGLPAWLLWRACYLMRMPTLGRKLRLWVEWTWAMAFAADITHLRFTGTREADATRVGGT